MYALNRTYLFDEETAVNTDCLCVKQYAYLWSPNNPRGWKEMGRQNSFIILIRYETQTERNAIVG
jgi:hypothetical protein